VRGILIALGLAALLLAGCGGGGGSTTGAAPRSTATGPASRLAAARADFQALAGRYEARIAALNGDLRAADQAGDVTGVQSGFGRMADALAGMRADLAAIDFPAALDAPAREAALALERVERLARRAAAASPPELRALARPIASAFSRLTGEVALLRERLGLRAS
jgi:hypothetical protein